MFKILLLLVLIKRKEENTVDLILFIKAIEIYKQKEFV